MGTRRVLSKTPFGALSPVATSCLSSLATLSASAVFIQSRNSLRVRMMPLPTFQSLNLSTSFWISRLTHQRYMRLSELRSLPGLTSDSGYDASSLRVSSRHSRYMRYGWSYLTFQKNGSGGASASGLKVLRRLMPRTTKPSTGTMRVSPDGSVSSIPPAASTFSQYVLTATTDGKLSYGVGMSPHSVAKADTSLEGSVCRSGVLWFRP